MPPRYLRKRSPTKLKPCAERMVEACDIIPADQCCGVIPCKLCLEWETYADGISYGSADFATSSWTGTVGGHAFVSYWERNYETGECEYVVTLDGEEVYRATCYEGASCRNPAGEVAVSTAYLEGTLRWAKYEPRELHLITDPDTGCNDFFCGTCRCSCDCLCVTITDSTGDVTTGEICDTAYECDPPVWEGTVGYYELSLALGRNQYGECIVTLTIDGEEQDPVAVTGCADMSATITLYDGTTIAVRCKRCTCDEVSGECECDGRCVPLVTDTEGYSEVANTDCTNPLPVELGVDVSATSSTGDSCFNGSGTITYKTPLTGGLNCWEGDITGSCTDCNGVGRTWTLRVVMCCPDSTQGATVSLESGSPGVIPVYDASVVVVPTSCDPFLVDGCIPGDINGWVVACLSTMPPTQTVYTNVCFSIYEVP